MKAHLADSNTPLKEGSDILANCGAQVPNGRFVFLWNNDEYPEFLSVSMTRICHKCAELELEKKYVYGVVSGQEAMDEARKGVESESEPGEAEAAEVAA